jgi:hypothetical protein
MKRNFAYVLLIAGLSIFVLVFVFSCKHEIPFNGQDPPVVGGTQTCSPDTVYFQNKVLPLLNSGCAFSGCHDAASHKSGVTLISYNSITGTGGVKPGNPAKSKLYTELSNGMPPRGYPAFTAAQKDIIFKWIAQGALNNACSDCDTSVYSYSGAVAATMNTYCKGCHNPSSLGGGIDVSTYAAVKAIAANGKLMGSILHSAGFSAMPKGTAKLSDCKITQVQKWMAAGTPNN